MLAFQQEVEEPVVNSLHSLSSYQDVNSQNVSSVT
jgi:hypothetical protein